MHLAPTLLDLGTVPGSEPWKCTRCEFLGSTAQILLYHFATDHWNVIKEILDKNDVNNLKIDMSFVPANAQNPNSGGNNANPGNSEDNSELKFPKCRLCNYRYFTRLDLCRHFVDFHLRSRLTNCLDPTSPRCPVCTLTYEKRQSRVRHLIWSHQDLEGLVLQDSHVRLSEFTPSERDLEMVKAKQEGSEEIHAITDLAALPVNDNIDVKLQHPFCELCGEEFKNSVNKARDKSAHLLGHFREDVCKDLPSCRPYKCPKCTFLGRDHFDLVRHYGLNHKAVFIAMQNELGDTWNLGDLTLESNDCKICGQAFLNPRYLNDHYCAQHFFSQIAQNLPSQPPFKCPQCSFCPKTQLALVRHMGNKHKLVKKMLIQEGLEGKAASKSASAASNVAQNQPNSSQNYDYYQQNQSWVNHYVQPQPQPPQPQPPPQPQAQQDYAQAQSYLPHQQSYPSPVQAGPSYDQPRYASPHPQPQLEQHQPQQHAQPPQQQQQVAQQPQQKSESPKVTTRSDQNPVACPICKSTFLNGTHFLRHAADKHFFDRLKADLPQIPPFNCPYCTQNCKDLKLLIRHYGLNHKMVLKFLNERNGLMDCYDDSILKQYETQESNRDSCPLCKSSFGGRYMLLRHLADCHFRERLCQALPQGGAGVDVYKCPECSHESKDKGGFVRHYGLVHKMVQTWLKEMGITGFDDNESKSSSPVVQKPQPQAAQPQQNYGYGYSAEMPPPAPSTSASSQYYTSPNYSNQLMSPSSQNSPQNLSSPQYYQQQPQQPQDLSQQPLDYSNGGYYPPQNYGPQPLTPQTPNPSVTPQPMTPQPMTPQPMTPGSCGAPPTPQPMTPQDQNSNSSTGLMSPGGYTPTNYYMQPQPPAQQQYQVPQSPQPPQPQQFQPQPQVQPPSQSQAPYQVPPSPRPVTLQPIDQPQIQPPAAAPPKPTTAASGYVPPGDEYIKAPEPGTQGPFAIQCLYCNGTSKNKSDFYRHLSERHFKAELSKELPNMAPYKCPVAGCHYETKDNSVGPLIKHYGIVHKSVQKYLRGQIAGRYIHNEAKASKPVQLEVKPQPAQQQQLMVNGSSGEETTMSNAALKVKCPFCDVMFSARYTFHQHLCDRHFKDTLAEQVPAQPPYACPVSGCGYVAKDSRQSLVRHYGMTHKVIAELLKRHVPDYDETEPFGGASNSDSQQIQLTTHQAQPVQLSLAPPPMPQVPQQHQQMTQLTVQTHLPPAGAQHHQQSPHVTQPSPHLAQQSPYLAQQSPHLAQQNLLVQQNQRTQDYYQQPPPQQEPQYQQQQDYYQGQYYVPDPNAGADLHFEPQMDGTFDPSHYSDQSSLDGFKSLPTTPVKQELTSAQPIVPPSPAGPASPKPTSSASKSRSGPKICEICGKQFEGKNRAMLKVQHMAQHFKDKLFADLLDKSPPFRCPVDGCQYQTKHKPDWARHYGSVHQLIAKYLKEYLETHEAKTEPLEVPDMPELNDIKEEPLEEKTYSAYLPKSELTQILNTAMDQQSQPQRNFGVITINSNNPAPDAEIPAENPEALEDLEEQLEPQQCFICPNGPWFKNEKDLNDHLSTQHIEFVQELKPRLEVLDDLGEVLHDLDIDQSLGTSNNSLNGGQSNKNRSTGRPCELCGFEPKTKNKSRERQDHLAMKHYRDRIQNDLTASTNFSCPLCNYVGKDKQTIYRHYTGKHKVVEQYLAEDIAAGRVETLAQKQAKEAIESAEAILTTSDSLNQVKSALPSFEATAMELQNSTAAGGLDLSLHGFVNEFLDGNEAVETGTAASSSSGMSSVSDHLSHIMQVDGFNDLESDSDDIPQLDGNEDEDMPEDDFEGIESNGTASFGNARVSPQIDSKCPICDFPTKMHKTYHLATKHFKERLLAVLPKEPPFKCTECNEYEAKARINMWTHFLGRHQYSRLWIREWQEGLAKEGPDFKLPVIPKVINGAPLAASSPLSKLQSMLEQRPPRVDSEVKSESNHINLPMPSLPPIEEIIKSELIKTEDIKAEIKTEPLEPSIVASTASPAKPSKPSAVRSSTEIRKVEFWCDLCQKVIRNVAKTTHFGSLHFEAKLKSLLPTSEPFLCSLCNHVGKDFNKLTAHFLNKHDMLDDWVSQELDVLEAEAIAKAGDNFFVKEDEADLQEIDSDVENEPPKEMKLQTLITQLYYDGLESPEQPRKKRKVIKSIKDHGLEGVKDFIQAKDDQVLKYRDMYKQKIPQSREPIPVRIMTSVMTSKLYPEVPHQWFCDGKMLMLTDPSHPENVKLFQDQWIRGLPVVVANVHKKLNMDIWNPKAFSVEFGHLLNDVVNTKSGKIVPKVPLKTFWDGFENLKARLVEETTGLPMLLKLKDWPPDNDLAHTLPTRFEDLMKAIPLPEYTKREGRFNLASYMPDFFAKPDLGPKMYIAYGNALYPETGTTNLHIDMSDACNLMVYVGIPQDGAKQDHIREGLKSVEESDCDPIFKAHVRDVNPVIGAIWHIYHPRDADKIRDMLNKVSLERGEKLEPNTDPIHDQRIYLDNKLRKRLYEEYGVVGFALPQREGDVVFIPAGAPHQVN